MSGAPARRRHLMKYRFADVRNESEEALHGPVNGVTAELLFGLALGKGGPCGVLMSGPETSAL